MNPISLADCLAGVPDRRHKLGKRHPLPAILNLVVAALLSGMRSLQGIAHFGRSLTPAQRAALGFRHATTPCKSTLSVVLRGVDLERLNERLLVWNQSQAGDARHIAIDGKTLRGSTQADCAAVHLLSLYVVDAGVTLTHLPVGDKTNEHKASLSLLEAMPLEGKMVTADAMFTHRDFCEIVRKKGADYLLIAKENQPTLRRDIAAMFAPKSGLSPPTESVAGRR